uniref:Uncharacterized protein n=1 Tax=Arundo donax TaxID=35708 RepID=A0A0A9AEA9_ARUDO
MIYQTVSDLLDFSTVYMKVKPSK